MTDQIPSLIKKIWALKFQFIDSGDNLFVCLLLVWNERPVIICALEDMRPILRSLERLYPNMTLIGSRVGGGDRCITGS